MKNNFVFQVWEGKKNQKNIFYDAWEKMKIRYIESLNKQTFEEQLLTEFRQLSNEVMSRFRQTK